MILRKRYEEARGKEGATHGRLREQDGFAMVMVVLAVSLLSIIGALSLLIAASSLKGIVNMKPEDRAFAIAEDAIALAHARIVGGVVTASPYTFNGTRQGGNYRVRITMPITGSTHNFTVVASSDYSSNGATYQRTISEDVSYYGDQAFDAMRNYLLFAGHNLTVRVDDLLSAGIPMRINGNIRAQNQTSLYLNPFLGIGDGLTINGRVEGQTGVYIESVPNFVGLLSDLTVNDDILSNGTVSLRGNGFWLLFVRLLGWVNTQDISANAITRTGSGCPSGGVETQGWQNLPQVYVPQPNLEYYKALAQQQGNYFVGDKTFNSGNLSDYSKSSVTVIYATGNMTMNGFFWNQPNMKGVFVCEGNFTANNTLKFLQNSKFQVIAKNNVTLNSNWDFMEFGTSDEFFMWSGHDVQLNMGMFSGLKLQVTALNDITVDSDNIVGTCQVNYSPPDVDVGGFPIDVVVSDWKELPSE